MRSLEVCKTIASKIIKLNNGISLDSLAHSTANLLKAGKVVALPTDTIYGIAALAQNTKAAQKIYDIKRRKCTNPLTICVADICDIAKWGKIALPDNLLQDLLPGPVTVLLDRTPALNPDLNPSVDLVAVRIPDSPFIRKVCLYCDEPIVLTSANISAAKSSLSIEEFQELWPDLDLIVDGGLLGDVDPYGLGSTIVNLSVEGFYKIHREGCALERVLEVVKQHSVLQLP